TAPRGPHGARGPPPVRAPGRARPRAHALGALPPGRGRRAARCRAVGFGRARRARRPRGGGRGRRGAVSRGAAGRGRADLDRAALAVASGLVLPRHEDTLARERSLFYACVSRPEEALFLSFRTSDEEGDPQQPSPFVDDVRALFTEELWTGRGRRLLAEVTWPP